MADVCLGVLCIHKKGDALADPRAARAALPRHRPTGETRAHAEEDPYLKAQAKEKQGVRDLSAPQKPKVRLRDQAAKEVGISGSTLQRYEKIQEEADEETHDTGPYGRGKLKNHKALGRGVFHAPLPVSYHAPLGSRPNEGGEATSEGPGPMTEPRPHFLGARRSSRSTSWHQKRISIRTHGTGTGFGYTG
jgi:hypothetical protein